MIELAGRTILITGASRGVGAAIARDCAGAGARALLHYGANQRAARDVAHEIGASEEDCLHCDLAERDAGDRLWAAALARAGRIDGLVNNAGVFEAGDVDDHSAWRRAWGRSLSVNLTAAADLCRAAIRHFRDAGGGTIVNIASRAAQRGDDPAYMAYAASKGGLVALTKSIARGFAGDGVLAYAVAPGWVDTDMGPRTPAEQARAEAEIPLGRVAAPEEISRLATFLLSGACPSATGATFDINGASYVR